MLTRLGLDMGTSSIGWALLDLDENGSSTAIRRTGVRIFSDGRDPKSGTSTAVDRRLARQARRQRDRYIRRRTELMDALVEQHLMPEDKRARKLLESLDPYELRARGLDEALEPFELGRALFHLNQRRGFKSNRKTDSSSDDETGIVKKAISDLRHRIDSSNARTLGEYLHNRLRKSKHARREFTDRSMYQEEFEALIDAQRPHHSHLTNEGVDRLRDIIFYQRPLRPVRPGKCTLDPTDERAPWALPIAQQFRIYQELNNLQIVHPNSSRTREHLDPEQREILLKKLLRQKKLTFKAMRKALGLSDAHEFNLEWENRKDLLGDQTTALLSGKKYFGPRWHDIDPSTRDKIVITLLDEESEAAVLECAVKEWGLDEETASRLVNAPLPVGYARIGRRAMSKIVPIMRDQGLMYSDAAEEANYSASDFRPDTLLEQLPYYGQVLERHVAFGSGDPNDSIEDRYGRIANPTVHIGLNQLRKLINEICNQYGRPDQITVELARDLKLSREAKIDVNRENKKNRDKNEAIAIELAALGVPNNVENRQRWKLWEELGAAHDRRCVFSGSQISTTKLFSNQVEIEHLLPFSRTLDDSMGNKTLCLTSANRDKKNRSPFEAFGSNSDPRYDWDQINARASKLPRNKRWRFSEDAMTRFDADGGFLARQLTDTSYLSRISREYLAYICTDVRATPGRMTALLRRKWGLNGILSENSIKNRNDHRQHAIDAAIVGTTDQGQLQAISRANRDGRKSIEAPPPWSDFRGALQESVGQIIVSHRQDHGSRRNGSTSGQLHNDTAYGIINGPNSEGSFIVRYRKPLASLRESEISKIVDPTLRKLVEDTLVQASSSGVKPDAALTRLSIERRIRRVRLSENQKGIIQISDSIGNTYKAYKGDSNDHLEIYETPDGKWRGEVISTFEAHQPGFSGSWRAEFPGAKLRMRLFKNDLVAIGTGPKRRILRVVKMAKSGRLTFADHNEAGQLKARDSSSDDPFKYFSTSFPRLLDHGARQVAVSVTGDVLDPGPTR